MEKSGGDRSLVYTSNHVISETLTLLAGRVSYQFAAERAEAIYFSREMEILYGSKEDEIEAVRLFRKFGDQRVSFTDCVSFVLMKRHGPRTAFTFDRHFRAAGLGVLGTSR
jgi:predicted nucleic acid-binding protein